MSNAYFILQKRVIRLLCGESGIIMFKLFACELPKLLQSRFSKYRNVHNTRKKNTFVALQARTTLMTMCLSVYGVKIWNALPEIMKQLQNIHIFKRKLKKYLIASY